MKLRVLLAIFICSFVVTPLLAEPPAQSGVVIRGEGTIGFYYADVKRGYIVVYGWDLFAECQGDPDYEISLWDYQFNDPPPDGVFHRLLKGDVATSVWGIEAAYNPCAHWPIATGTSSVVSNLNGKNVANLSAHGVLTDPLDGETMVFISNLHCVVDDYEMCVDKFHAKIVLH